LKSFKIGDLEIRIPIIQGGMGVGISLSGLAAAVANQGGVGVISTVGLGQINQQKYTSFRKSNIDALTTEIRKARSLSDGVIGVNIMVALTNFADMVETSIKEGIDIIFSGAGLPLDLPKYLTEGAKTKLAPIVSSARAVDVLCNKWMSKFNYLPDAIVVEGPEAGGHLGFKLEQIEDENFSLERLIPEVLTTVKKFEEKYDKKIPVIAGGGIYTGEDILNYIRMGASGVQMGTRFVATKECDASDSFKQTYVNAKKEDIVIVKSPVGMPGRAIVSQFLKDTLLGKTRPVNCSFHCIITCDYKTTPYCIADALLQAQSGNIDDGFAFSGSNAWRIDKIISVKELMDSLQTEYDAAEKLHPLA
jgi:nitronate monooxygenase